MDMNIAIDGPSAAGKSTIAKKLCAELGYTHLDTGAMYRCVAYQATLKKIDFNDVEQLVTMMQEMKLEMKPSGEVILDGQDVSACIRTNEISMGASAVSKHAEVRKILVAMQQKIAQVKRYIMDGRDIGTVVLPDAEVKIFLTASSSARAKRRYAENLEKGIQSDFDSLVQEIEKRDYDDSHRTASPLKKAEDAIEVDTSELSIEQVVNKILKIVEEKQEAGQ